jgi:hypothetical protein
MAIVGHAESNKYAGWFGTTVPAIPASIGVSGFAINNRVGGLGQAWGGYFDAVRLTNGFTVGIEVAIANFGSESTPTPFNIKTGGVNGGVSAWLQSGAGLDAVGYPGTIQDAAAGIVLLSSYVDNSAKFRKGMIIADGALTDLGGTSYGAIDMPTRHQISWYRTTDSAQAGFIWTDVTTGPAVGLTIKTGGVEITGGGTLVNQMFLAPQSTGQSPYLAVSGSDTNIGLNFHTKGTGSFLFNPGSALVATISSFALNLEPTKVFAINNLQVVSARKTGWALATGTATRTTFATGSVTLPQLAEHVKALIDDLHSTAGHGLLGA